MNVSHEMLALIICWNDSAYQYVSSALKRIGVYSISVEEAGFTRAALEALTDTPVTMVVVDTAFVDKAPYQLITELFPEAIIIKVSAEPADKSAIENKRELAMRMRFPGATA